MPTASKNSLQSFTSCSMIKCEMCWTQQDLDYLECSILPVPMLPIALFVPLFFGANMVVIGFGAPQRTPESHHHKADPSSIGSKPCNGHLRDFPIGHFVRPGLPRWKFLQGAKTDWNQRLQLFPMVGPKPEPIGFVSAIWYQINSNYMNQSYLSWSVIGGSQQ